MLGRSPARAGRVLVVSRATSLAVSLFVALALPVAARAAEPAADAPVARAAEPATDAPVARAAPTVPELALTWQAPAGCPSSGDVQAQFARLLGGAARAPTGKHIAATLVVRSSAPETWTLELATVLDGAAGRRTLESDSCASVTSAAALILALMIDPAAAERAVAESAPAPPPPVAPPPKAPTILTFAPPETAPAPRTVFGFARVFAGGVAAFLPSPAPAAGLALGARRRRLAAELTVLATEERSAPAATLTPTAGGDFRLIAGGARACGELGGRAVIWSVCAGGELERLSGAGFGANAGVSPEPKSALMGAGTGGLLVTLPLGPSFALALDLDAVIRVYRPTLEINTTDRVFQVPLASAFAALGIIITI